MMNGDTSGLQCDKQEGTCTDCLPA